MRRFFLYVIVSLLSSVCAFAQTLSMNDLEKVYGFRSWENINSYFHAKKWEGNINVISDTAFEVGWQYSGIEDIMVKQDSKGHRFISYRLHNQQDIDNYLQNQKNFKGYEQIASSDKNMLVYRKKNCLQLLTKNRTRGILTIRIEESKDQAFWTDLIDKCNRTSNYIVGSYLPEEGGVLVGFSPDGTLGYVVAMNDAKHGNGCSWSSTPKLVSKVFTSSDWHKVYGDFEGQQNTSSVNSFLSANNESQKRAAELASAYDGGGKNDWYLPSIGQLRLMADNKADIDEGLRANGGIPIAKVWYWSSTQYSDRMVWAYDFKNLIIGQSSKDGHDRVRPVRSFSIKR